MPCQLVVYITDTDYPEGHRLEHTNKLRYDVGDVVEVLDIDQDPGSGVWASPDLGVIKCDMAREEARQRYLPTDDDLQIDLSNDAYLRRSVKVDLDRIGAAEKALLLADSSKPLTLTTEILLSAEASKRIGKNP